ncbi:CinA family protein [Agrococcus sp. SGAir0287]|uniref:CinA family protein n=1 Tax=Agrococcus sp. SGAir0287 TaxID=2070347 RepID=UPI0010CD686C|nr:CinA family protein [Agrococcus sp. SGAir0287]QCR20437.1 CinA family protein [Agrococcus sp. SGAir0287]
MPDFDEDLQERIARRVQEDGLSVGVAESLTGGLLTDALATSEGSGEWLRGGIVAYGTEVKRSLLAVDGPVISRECATQMADAARRLLGADVGLGITGVGGPDRQEGQPVGTVLIACATPDGSIAEEHAFDGDAPEIVDASVEHGMRVLLRALDGAQEVRHG